MRPAVPPSHQRHVFVPLSVTDGARSLVVDGMPSLANVPVLDRLGESRGSSYVIRAERLAETAWEVQVSPL